MRLDKWSGLNIKYFSNNNIKSSIYRYMQNEHSFIKHASADHTTTFTRSQTYGHSLTSLPLHAYTHARARTHIHTHTPTHAHTHTHTHTHTYVHSLQT